MATASSQEEDSFTCPVCLELLTKPVTIPCGHNFCMRCINGIWDKDDLKIQYSCPVCTRSFCARPDLYINPVIAEMVDKCRKTSLQGDSHARCSAGPEHVACDLCTQRKVTAVKSCLECLKSYCDFHLKDHNELVKFGRNHTTIDATNQLQERICPRHKKVFEFFCRTDQSCICYLCLKDEHKGHDTVTAAEESSNKKEDLEQRQRRCQQIIQLKEKELQDLRKAVEAINLSAQRLCAEMGLEIAGLKRKDVEMKQLSMTQDPIHFLKNNVPMTDDLCNSAWTSRTLSFIEPMQKSVSALNRQLDKHIDTEVPIRRSNSKKGVPPNMSEDKEQAAKPVTRDLLHNTEVLKKSEDEVRRSNSKDCVPPNMSEGNTQITEPVTGDPLNCLIIPRSVFRRKNKEECKSVIASNFVINASVFPGVISKSRIRRPVVSLEPPPPQPPL